jgi:hypothetical protein
VIVSKTRALLCEARDPAIGFSKRGVSYFGLRKPFYVGSGKTHRILNPSPETPSPD